MAEFVNTSLAHGPLESNLVSKAHYNSTSH